jgi:uncharacterized protein
MTAQIAALSRQLTPILKSNGVVFAGLFGSQARGDAKLNSDYDFLIEFHPQKKYTLLDLAGVKEELERELNKSVDVVTPNGLDRYIKQEVLNSVISFYDNR